MKALFAILFILSSSSLFGQPSTTNFPRIDREAIYLEGSTDPATLSRELTTNCTTDLEKVRSFFKWITSHISYYRPSPVNRRKHRQVSDDLDEELDVLLPLTERVARKVLADRRTHCEGYARLFQSLCDHAGIRATIISGYARTEDGKSAARFRSNHSWNAVYTDSAWHLLDVTWASGFLTYSSDDFIRQYNEYYFYTDPSEFARHHFPDDLRWTLLTEPPSIDELRKTPYHPRSFAKYGVNEIMPARGIIEAMVGDTLRFEIETNLAFRMGSITPDSLWDSASLLYTPVFAYIKPVDPIVGKKISYSFPVENEAVRWIHLMYNDDAILRYRINVRRRPEGAPVVIAVSSH